MCYVRMALFGSCCQVFQTQCLVSASTNLKSESKPAGSAMQSGEGFMQYAMECLLNLVYVYCVDACVSMRMYVDECLVIILIRMYHSVLLPRAYVHLCMHAHVCVHVCMFYVHMYMH